MPASYSYRWANEVATTLGNSYPRATDIFCDILDISIKDLANFLARGDPIFPICRNLIHFIDRIGSGSAWKHDLDFYRANIAVFCRQKQIKRILDRLDKVSNFAILKEQAFKARDGGGQAADPSRPLDLFPREAATWRKIPVTLRPSLS